MATQINTDKQASKTLGLTLQVWIWIFAVVAAVPLLNLLTLPIAFVGALLVFAVYLMKRYWWKKEPSLESEARKTRASTKPN